MDSYIKQQQIRNVFKNNVYAITGSFIAAILFVSFQWQVVDQQLILYWLAVLTVFNLIRIPIVIKYRKKIELLQKCDECGKVLFLTSLIAGIIWMIGIFLAFPENNLTYQISIFVIFLGLAAGAISTLSDYIQAFLGFVIPMATSILIMSLSESTYEGYLMAIGVVVVMIYISRGAFSIYESHKQNLMLLAEAEQREKALVDANEKVLDSNKTQSKFLANMSHELRTPLHGVIAFSSLGAERLDQLSKDKTQEYFSLIYQSGERLKDLLDDLLDLSKIEAGKFILKYEACNLIEIINSCIDEQNSIALERNISIELKTDENLPEIECDKKRVGQVFMNLLSNAIKFSPDGGKVLFEVKQQTISRGDNKKSNALCVTLTDEGPGIDETEFEVIFDKFVQSEKNMTQNGSGTGLGLSISKELVQLHDGSIWCQNSEETGGAMFHTLIPVKNQA